MADDETTIRVTVCQLPHAAEELESAWSALCEHTAGNQPDIVLLPELSMVNPIWEVEQFDPSTWTAAEQAGAVQIRKLSELTAEHVVGTRPVTIDGRRLNQGYIWSSAAAVIPLRSKFSLPAEDGSWEAHWFERGDTEFPVYRASELLFGLNICTEIWALESYTAYAAAGVHAILSPRATAAHTTEKWLAAGVVGAVRSGAYSLSSNRIDQSGACGGGSWVITPNGKVLALTTAALPFATVEIDLAESVAARDTYPRYVLR